MIRLAALVWLLGGFSSALAQLVVIREIMYRPMPGQPEYLVISNQSRTVFDLAGWRTTQGVAITLPEYDPHRSQDSFLRPFESFVLSSASPAAARAAYRWPESVRVFGPWIGDLADDGESIRLEDDSGQLVCRAVYAPEELTTTAADGSARVLVAVDVRRPLDDPMNWRPANQPGADAVTGTSPLAIPTNSGGGESLVINEIMYDLPAGHGGVEFIELHNPGTRTVDLSGWRLTGGIRFDFPNEASLAPGGFLVISKDAHQMRRLYGPIPVIGDFQGKLSSRGERVRLVDEKDCIIDQVHYFGGGRWPERARGRGSSLELVHPGMDNARASAWEASRDLDSSPFLTCMVTGVYRQARAPGQAADYKELHVYLADDGAALLRNIELRRSGTNCLENADRLGTGADGWLASGTHWASEMSNGELHLVAEGHGDNRANHVELDVPALEAGEFFELRMEARWLSGCPRLIVQLFDQSLAGSFALPIPDRLGTPGLPNSTLAERSLPQIDELIHHPSVPAPAQPIRVLARIYAPEGLREARARYRLEGQDWKSVQAFDDGQNGGDETRGDGIYTARIEEDTQQGDVLQFYMEATARQGVQGFGPRQGPQLPAMLVVDGRALPEELRLVRVVVWPDDVRTMGAGDPRFPRLSNRYWPATVIDGDRAVYGAGARPRGSPLTRTPDLERLNVKWPADSPHRGQRRWVYDDDAAKGIAYHNRVARYLLALLDQPVSDSEFVRLIVNAGPAQLREETEPIGKEFLDRRFEDGRKGELYKVDDQWWMTDAGQGEMEDASWDYEGERVELYRNAWMKRTGESQDDYSRLLALFRSLSAASETEELNLDAEAILRVAAVRGLIGDWDNFTMQRGRNAYFYSPPGEGGFRLLHWDSDEAFMTGPPLYGPFIERWLEQPDHHKRFQALIRQLLDATVDRPGRLRTWLALEREATQGAVFQADYLAFFGARGRELRENAAGLLDAQSKDTLSDTGTVRRVESSFRGPP